MTRPSFPVLTLVLAGLTTMGALGIDLFLPATEAVGREFGTDSAGVQVTLAAFSIGFGIGQFAHGPLSDRFGRRPALIGSFLVLIAAALAAAFAPDLEALAACRFVVGISAAAGVTVGRAIVRDLFAREAAARLLSYMMMIAGIGPIAFPIAGGQLVVAFGWQSTFLFMAGYVGVLVAVFAWLIPETLPRKNPDALHPVGLFLACREVMRSRTFRAYAACNCFTMVGLFAFLTASPAVLIEAMGETPDQYGYDFAIAVSAMIVAAMAGGRLVVRIGIDRMVLVGAWIALAAGASMAGLALSGVATVAAVIAPIALFLTTFGLVVPGATAAALTPFPQIAGIAASLLGFIQQCVAVATTLIIAALGATQTVMAVTVLVAGAGVLVSFLALVVPARRQTRVAPEAAR